VEYRCFGTSVICWIDDALVGLLASGLAPAPRPAAICANKQILSDEVLDALRVLTTVHALQASDVIRGDPGLPGLDLALTAARAKWEQAKQGYKIHVLEHG